ncbi:MAG: hypothetical protein WDM70_03145 [Nitrosomonadales bacterium]
MNDNGATGDLIPNAVSKVARLGATIHNVGPWSVAAETRYIGAYPLTQDGSLTAPSALVTNLRIEREILRVRLYRLIHSICLTASITISPMIRITRSRQVARLFQTELLCILVNRVNCV